MSTCPNCKSTMGLEGPSRHDPYWYWLCPGCRAESPKYATEKMALAYDSTAREPEPAPTLSPEVAAVLDAAVAWTDRFGDAHFNNHKTDCALCDIITAVRAWLATLSPKDYAPDELEPGTRFRFGKTATRPSGGYGGVVVLVRGGRSVGKCAAPYQKRWMADDFRVAEFAEDDRLIPLPEQDGSDRPTPTPNQERDTKW